MASVGAKEPLGPLDEIRREYLELSELHYMALRMGCYRVAESWWPLLSKVRELLVSVGG